MTSLPATRRTGKRIACTCCAFGATPRRAVACLLAGGRRGSAAPLRRSGGVGCVFAQRAGAGAAARRCQRTRPSSRRGTRRPEAASGLNRQVAMVAGRPPERPQPPHPTARYESERGNRRCNAIGSDPGSACSCSRPSPARRWPGPRPRHRRRRRPIPARATRSASRAGALTQFPDDELVAVSDATNRSDLPAVGLSPNPDYTLPAAVDARVLDYRPTGRPSHCGRRLSECQRNGQRARRRPRRATWR